MRNKIIVTSQARDNHTVYIDVNTKIPYVNLAQLERMFPEVSTMTLSRRLSSFEMVPQFEIKTAEIYTSQGVRMVSLFPPEAVFELALEFDKTLAKSMGCAGAAVYLYGIAGYRVEPVSQTSTTRVLTEFETIEMVEKASDTCVKIQETFAHYDARLAQICIDRIMQVVTSNQNLLPAPSEPQLSGCVEIATNLGFNVGKEDSSLGRFVAKSWRNAYDNTEPQISKRECGGAMRKLKVYPSDDPVVTSAIKEYYAKRNNKL